MFSTQSTTRPSFLAFISIALLTVGVLVVLFTGCGTQPAAKTVPTPQPERHVQANDWPAYAPNKLVVPANSLVTITLHDYDLGLDSPMPKGTPFASVQGTIGGVAYLNGQPYAALAPEQIAHTFTIPQLHINVPLPGFGKESDTISFTFRIGKAGTYTFQCFDPCGTGNSGFEGPMATKGYMVGTLTVH